MIMSHTLAYPLVRFLKKSQRTNATQRQHDHSHYRVDTVCGHSRGQCIPEASSPVSGSGQLLSDFCAAFAYES